jgi:hypothetical protein
VEFLTTSACNILLMISDLTVAEPSPDEIWLPLELSCSSSPRNRIEVISQLPELTVIFKELVEPASTTMLLPLVVIPKAARAGEAKAKAAKRAC